MPALNNEQSVALEALIDSCGPDSVLQALEMICDGKSDHLAEDWQDGHAAAAWQRAGTKIGKLAADPKILAVS